MDINFAQFVFLRNVASLRHCTINPNSISATRFGAFIMGFFQYMKQHDLKWYLASIPYNSESFCMISWVTSDSLVLITMVTFSSVKNYSP